MELVVESQRIYTILAASGDRKYGRADVFITLPSGANVSYSVAGYIRSPGTQLRRFTSQLGLLRRSFLKALLDFLGGSSKHTETEREVLRRTQPERATSAAQSIHLFHGRVSPAVMSKPAAAVSSSVIFTCSSQLFIPGPV